jgi:hypothetical protein
VSDTMSITSGSPLSDAELVREAITASGLSARRFAALVWRDERTVRRWVNGQSPIPGTVRVLLETGQHLATCPRCGSP